MNLITNKHICITGATGFLSSHIIILLLQNNNYVHAITRNKELFEKEYLYYIKNIVNLKINNLKIFESNSDTKSFTEPLNNCEFLIHCASPVILKSFNNDLDNLKYIIEPSINYTENILTNITLNIKKVIFTSSTCAIYNNNKKIYTNEDWCNIKDKDPYTISKILSEKKAWEIYNKQKDNLDHWDLIVINPGRIIGPLIYKHKIPDSYYSINELLNYYNIHTNTITNYYSSFCDVRDVAKIHIIFLNNNIPINRYIISFEIKSLIDYHNIITTIEKYKKYNNILFNNNSELFEFCMKNTNNYLSNFKYISFEKSLLHSLFCINYNSK